MSKTRSPSGVFSFPTRRFGIWSEQVLAISQSATSRSRVHRLETGRLRLLMLDLTGDLSASSSSVDQTDRGVGRLRVLASSDSRFDSDSSRAIIYNPTAGRSISSGRPWLPCSTVSPLKFFPPPIWCRISMMH